MLYCVNLSAIIFYIPEVEAFFSIVLSDYSAGLHLEISSSFLLDLSIKYSSKL